VHTLQNKLQLFCILPIHCSTTIKKGGAYYSKQITVISLCFVSYQ